MCLQIFKKIIEIRPCNFVQGYLGGKLSIKAVISSRTRRKWDKASSSLCANLARLGGSSKLKRDTWTLPEKTGQCFSASLQTVITWSKEIFITDVIFLEVCLELFTPTSFITRTARGLSPWATIPAE